MATVNYTSLLGLALPTTGDLSGTWGNEVNNFITQYLDSAVEGTQTISGSQTSVTLSVTNGTSLSQVGSGATGSAQYAIVNCTGNPASTLTITAPASSREYIVINATSTSQSVTFRGSGPTTGVSIASGERCIVAWNGSDFVKVASTVALPAGSTTQVQYNNAGALAGSANMTFNGTRLTVADFADSSLTSGRVTYATTGGNLTDNANLQFDGNNLGLGVTPSAWGGGGKPLQAVNASFWGLVGTPTFSSVGANYFYDGAYKYISNGLASDYFQLNGAHGWRTAASGTAGNAISFTTAMTLDASGNLGLGVTPSAWSASYRTLQLSGGAVLSQGGNNTYVGNNWYNDGSNRYIATAAVALYEQSAGAHRWYQVASGTAGSAITSFTTALQITATNFTQPLAYADTVSALGNTGTATTINLRNGNVFTATLTGNCTFTLSNPIATGSSSFTLILTNDGTAGRTVAWSGGAFRFPGGAASLSRTTTANATDIWVFFTPDGGTTWYGNIAMKNMAA